MEQTENRQTISNYFMSLHLPTLNHDNTETDTHTNSALQKLSDIPQIGEFL